MATILITGGSGLIGQHIIPKLLDEGHTVHVLSRRKSKGINSSIFQWSVDDDFIEEGALEGVDHIIHLAGYNVAEGRWTEKRKKLMEDSRIKSINLLKSKLEGRKIKSFISASGVSIYGVKTTDKIFSEADQLEIEEGDYLAGLSARWEEASNGFTSNAERVVIFRTPVVLSKSHGALNKLAGPIKMGIGSPLGTGKQWMPWVHIDDIAEAYLKAVREEKLEGIFNVVAPDHKNNAEFTKAVAKVLDKKLWLPKVPSFLLKIIYGEMAGIILKGSRVSGEKIEKEGFKYEYTRLNESLEDLLITELPTQ